jgi:hypothetical protein
MMRPVNQAAEIIPLVHAANTNPVTQSDRDPVREIDIMCDQQCSAVTDIENEALMPRVVIVVRQKARDETGNFDPRAGVALCEWLLQALPCLLVLSGRFAVNGERAGGSPDRLPPQILSLSANRL